MGPLVNIRVSVIWYGYMPSPHKPRRNLMPPVAVRFDREGLAVVEAWRKALEEASGVPFTPSAAVRSLVRLASGDPKVQEAIRKAG